MGKKVISLILLLVFFTSLLPAVSLNVNFPDYEPYRDEEFAPGLLKLRRAESLFFGSLAITLPVSIGGYNAVDALFPVNTPEEASTRLLQQVAIAAGISLFIVTIDYIIGEIRGE
jgi:hypothetical protein